MFYKNAIHKKICPAQTFVLCPDFLPLTTSVLVGFTGLRLGDKLTR